MPYRWTLLDFPHYSARMEAELKTLEDKLTQFVEVNQRLRDDTQRLRQELASALHRNKQLEEKIQTASNRLEELVQQIPAEEA
jgi:cell division septum initiation protein DivIVA